MNTQVFTYSRQGRSLGTALVVGLIYLALLWLWVGLSIAPFFIAIGVAVTLPAIYDLAANPQSGMTIDTENLVWHHGRRNMTIARQEIKRLHIHLRMDRSIKLLIETENGRKIRVMQPAIPPLAILEGALTQQGIAFQNHPFSLI